MEPRYIRATVSSRQEGDLPFPARPRRESFQNTHKPDLPVRLTLRGRQDETQLLFAAFGEFCVNGYHRILLTILFVCSIWVTVAKRTFPATSLLARDPSRSLLAYTDLSVNPGSIEGTHSEGRFQQSPHQYPSLRALFPFGPRSPVPRKADGDYGAIKVIGGD
jgi:hypothetical protein